MLKWARENRNRFFEHLLPKAVAAQQRNSMEQRIQEQEDMTASSRQMRRSVIASRCHQGQRKSLLLFLLQHSLGRLLPVSELALLVVSDRRESHLMVKWKIIC